MAAKYDYCILTYKLPPLCPSILSPAPTATCISVANMAKLPSVPDSQVFVALGILASKIDLVVYLPSACLFQLVMRNGRLHLLSLTCDFAMLSKNHLLQKLWVSLPALQSNNIRINKKAKAKKNNQIINILICVFADCFNLIYLIYNALDGSSSFLFGSISCSFLT